MSVKQRPPTWVGWLVIALGIYPLTIATGVLPVAADSVHAPMWVLGLCGFIFMVAGAMVLFGHHTRLNDGMAAFLLLAMCACGAWVALRAPADGFSGGLPFLRHETNVMLGRGLFGIGAIITGSLAAYALRRALRPPV